MAVLRDSLLAWPSGSRGRTALCAVGLAPDLLDRLVFANTQLNAWGFELRVVADPAMAAVGAPKHRTLYLVDVAIGASEVHGFLRETRARAPFTAVVAIGRAHEEEMLAGALDDGAVDYLTAEEITAPVLRRVLRYAIDRERLQRLAKRIYQDSERQEQRLRAVVAALPQAALLLDGDGWVQAANAMAEDLLGRSVEVLRTLPVEQWGWGSPGGGAANELYVPLATLQDGYIRTGRLRTVSHPDGRQVEVRVDARPLYEGGPFRPTGVVVLLAEPKRS
jgi:PAS domain-containing protein